MQQLLILMYHRVGSGKHATSYEKIYEHLTFLKNHFPNLLPGEPLQEKGVSITITFDDATFDFYHYIYPLLKKLSLRAVLGVPVRYILESTQKSTAERLAVPYFLSMQEGIFDTKAPMCTWQELREMVESGYVEIASHSFSHPNLTFPFVNLEKEVVVSKSILEEKLPQAVSSFIYPFGRVTPAVHAFVKKHYAYAFRIGSAGQKNWVTLKPLSRIPADSVANISSLFHPWQLTKYFLKRCRL